MNKSWFVALIVLSLVLAACMPATNSVPVSEAPAATEAPTEESIVPSTENIGGAVVEWLKDPKNSALVVVGIGGIAALDDAVGFFPDDLIAAITISGITTYQVYLHREQISEGVAALVTGAEGLRAWVRENFQVVVPSEFRLEGGNVAIQAPGVTFTATWSLTNSGGCNYDGYLNGDMLSPLTTDDPCSPINFLAWIASQLDYLRSKIGDRADELLRALNDLIGPFVK